MIGKLFKLVFCLLPLLCAAAVVFWAASYQNFDADRAEIEGVHFSHVSVPKSGGMFKEITASIWRGQLLVGYFNQRLTPDEKQTASGLDREMRARVGWHGNFRPMCIEPWWGFTLVGGSEYASRSFALAPIGARVTSQTYRVVGVPIWLLAVVMAGVWVGQLRVVMSRGRRTKPGCCTTCGYDLTGNVSGVCPECGGEVKQGKGRVERVREFAEARLSFSEGLVMQAARPVRAGV